MLTMILTDEVKFKEIEDNLDVFYDIIGCDTIDIVTRTINGAGYEIICDDEGLLKAGPVVTAVSRDGRPQLVGGLIVAKYGGNGELAGLAPEDVLRLSNAIQYTIQKNKLQPVIILEQ